MHEQHIYTIAKGKADPVRIRGLRKLAKEHGYNPDIWFDNVEIIAAEKVGAATVHYVSNIYEEKKKVK